MGLDINPEPIKNGTEHNRGKGKIAAAGFGPLGETPPMQRREQAVRWLVRKAFAKRLKTDKFGRLCKQSAAEG